MRADTDGNGLVDSVEDPDRDGLSNWGEQRFETDPLDSDTDGDGTIDGRDDSNRDGVADGSEQDDGRPLPDYTRPSIQGAAADKPISYQDDCHVTARSSTFKECNYGSTGGRYSVALFGDSHAEQWLPALIQAATHRDWTINNLTRSGCPSADVYVWDEYENGPDTRCAAFRDQAINWLRAHPPDLIVLSNLRGTTLYNKDGTKVPRSDRERRWAIGLQRTLSRLPRSSQRVVLADGAFVWDPIGCLRRHRSSFGACEQARSSVIDQNHNKLEKRIVKSVGGAFVDLTRTSCPYDPCPIITGNVLMYRDTGHMSATFSRTIWRPLADALAPLLRQRST